MSRTQAGARISPGAVWLLYAETGIVFALFLFASIVSFSGLYSIAPWLGLPPVLYWALPLGIDIGIIGYKLAEVILRNDERKASKVKKAVFGTIAFTALSSAGNVVHVAALQQPDPLHYWGGVVLAGLMPWAVYLAASVLTDLIVKPYRAPAAAQSEPAVAVAPTKPATRPRPPRTKPAPKPKPPRVREGQQVVPGAEPFRVTPASEVGPPAARPTPPIKPFPEVVS